MQLAVLLLAFLPTLILAEKAPSQVPPAFENNEIQRTINLGGSLTTVNTLYTVKPLGSTTYTYIVALSPEEEQVTSALSINIKKGTEYHPLKVKKSFSPTTQSYNYHVELPKLAPSSETYTLAVSSVQSHASFAWPTSAAQTASQRLKYVFDAIVLSPYPTILQGTKLKSGPGGAAKILDAPSSASFSTLSSYSSDTVSQKSGATVSIGPFNDLPPTAKKSFQKEKQARVEVRYEYNDHILTITELFRIAEISHWGSNLNVQDDIKLRNDGPTLKGQFSRVDYQVQKFSQRVSPSTVERLKLLLPPGIHSPYYYDLNGNVSTSRFRAVPSTSNSKKAAGQQSLLELRPRYPLLGGWNYTFTLGWDAPLADSAKFDKKTGKYWVGVPFWTPIHGATVDDATWNLVLPEGAVDYEVFPPFEPLSVSWSTHITYLDTVGRPKVTLTARKLSDAKEHRDLVYVSYRLPSNEHFRKPLAITAGTLGLFALNFIWKRVDGRIGK